MAQAVYSSKLATRTARAKLGVRREPYWQVIGSGLTIGYRRSKDRGAWIAKYRDDDGRRVCEVIATADDRLDPDGSTVLSFNQAQELARAFHTRKSREDVGDVKFGPCTVSEALDAYFSERERRGSKGVTSDKTAAGARITPLLGSIVTPKLTATKIKQWHMDLACAPKLIRSKQAAKERAVVDFDHDDEDAVRARRATANRILTILKAALNHSYHNGQTPSDEAWRKVKPFREVDSPVVRYLMPDECERLINACDEDFRALVRGALATGCRYGELVRMKVADFDVTSRTVAIRASKSGKPRHVPLNDDGSELFLEVSGNRAGAEAIFQRADGGRWGVSHQIRRLQDASQRAGVEPGATFHILRHTYASALARAAVPIQIIALALGHADTRITMRHYAHLSPSVIADTIRAAIPNLQRADRPPVAKE